MQWSEEQKAIISGRGNMLVSASAGSGKTTVMIEKIRQLLLGGASLDDMLISTYTVAAAADMRYKLAQALEACCEDNVNCREQLDKLPQAQIGTLHSLCSRLIKTRFYLTDADPAFEMLGESEAAAMKTAAVEAAFTRGGDRFSVVYDALLSGRSDKALKHLVLTLLDFSRTQPDPDGWLDGCLTLYDDPAAVDAALAALYGEERDRLTAAAEQLLVDTEAAGYARNVAACRALVDYIETGVSPKSPTGKVGDHIELNERYKALRDSVKAYREEVESAAALPTADAAKADAQLFVRLVRETARAYADMKAKKALLDYSDLEHKALEILEAGGDEAAQYKYVFVDEYQDINPLQERIVERLARGAELFQVGDVKQSIYAFRLCDPGIFLKRFAAYRAGAGGRAVELNVNYRSDGGVLQAVNRVFDRWMTPAFGGVDYAAQAQLKCGRGQHTPNAATLTVVCGSDKPDLPEVYRVTGDGGTRVGAQAALVAKDIAGLLDGRNIKPEQIAVIMRSRSPLLYEIAAALSALGIESAVCAKEAPAESDAVRPLLNALQLIDNRCDDVMLAAVLLSPFGGFTAAELATLPQAESFVAAATACDGALRERLEAFFTKFDRYERMAAVMPADELAGVVAGEAEYFEYLYAQENGRALAAEAGAFLAMMSASGHVASLSDYLAFALRAPAVERVTGAGAVKLMTVHAAKGLEFDYVFFPGTEAPFRLDDAVKPATADRQWGLVVKHFDEDAREIAETKLTRLSARSQRKRMLEEELRILYVALTRAKEKLFIYGKRGKRYAGEDLKPNCNLNFLLPAFVAVDYVEAAEVDFAPPARVRVLSRPDPALSDEIKRRLQFDYAEQYGDTHLPQKTTVTKAAEAYDDRDWSVPSVGNFDGERAAAIGTAYHLMMEHIDFDIPFDAAWERLCRAYPKESALCKREEIAAAAACVRALSDGWKLYREKEFIVSENGLLIQGIVDLLLVRGNEAIVLDYKTTRAENLLRGEYIFQTGFYARAVEKLLGLKVSRVLLYSFYLGKSVEMPYDSMFEPEKV